MRHDLVAGDRLVAATAPMSGYCVGTYLGDMLVEGDDIFGDGVNNAARLEEMADDAISTILATPPEMDRCSRADKKSAETRGS